MKTKYKNIILLPFNFLFRFNPAMVLKMIFKMKTGYSLDLKNPKTFSEKIQWLKLNYKNPQLPKLVDKYTVRDYVRSKCPELLNELIWDGFNPNDIPWDNLPEKFVIKATHGSGYNIICDSKNEFCKEIYTKILNSWLKEDFIICYGEWFYGVVKPRIIIEKYLDDGSGQSPVDYKFFCFDGEPKYISVDTERFKGHKKNVYDLSWNFLEGVCLDLPNDKPIEKPNNLEEMIYYARILSKGFPLVRVDLYSIHNKIYFGEMTFTPGAGFDKITPYEFDVEMGRYVCLEDTYM